MSSTRFWEQQLVDSKGIVQFEVATKFVLSVHDSIREQEWQKIDQVLQTQSPDDVNPELLVTLLRITYRWRSKLPNWQPFLEKACTSFESRNLYPKLLQKLL